ncbi:MAG: ATP/GTP-binding protein [Thermoplasmatota archaeon]
MIWVRTGTQVAAADMIALNLEEVQAEIDTFRSDLVLVDTPGQLELFVFRQSGRHIVQSLNPGRSAVLYLLDPFLARSPSGFASQLMLAATVQFRFQDPMLFLLSKCDRIDESALERIRAWAVDAEALESDVLGEEPSMNREFAAHATRLLATMAVENHIVAVSATESTGLDDLYAMVQGALGEGEDATPEYDTFLAAGQEEPGDEPEA